MNLVRALAIFMAVTVSCESAPMIPTASAPASETRVRGGRIVVGGAADAILQPILANDSGSQAAIRLVYATLLEDDTSGALRGALAERFETSADGKKVTFVLRHALWSDGVPVTGDDYKYTVEATARSKKTTSKSKFQDIVGWSDYLEGRASALRGISVTSGGNIIEITLERSSCSSTRQLNTPMIPRHHFAKHWDSATTDRATSIDDSSYNSAPPAASGPFVFKERRLGDQLTFARNDRYYRGAPLLDEIILKHFSGPDPERNAFVADEIDWIAPRPGDVEYVRQQRGAASHEYRVKDKFGYAFISWNQKASRAPWLADKRVRQALWYGLDVKTMINTIELGYGHPVYAHTPQPSWAYDGSGLNRYEYDVARARSLLETAGANMGSDGFYRWSNGAPMEIRVETNANNPARVSMLEIAVQQYKQIGIRIVPVIESFQLLVQRITPSDGSVEGVLLGWNLEPDPDAYRIWHSTMQGAEGYNFAGMNNAALDAALHAGRYGPDCSTAARKMAYQTMDRILNEEAPYTFLHISDSVIFVSNKLVIPPPAPFSVWPDIEKWWVRP